MSLRLIHYRTSTYSTRGFTLVELLVSIVIIGIIGGMVSTAITGASRQAKETRAAAFVNRLNLVVLQLYEESATRRVGLPSSVWSGQSVNQTQLIWRRDWLRASLPQSKADVDAGSGRSGAPAVFGAPFIAADGTLTILPPTQRTQVAFQFRERVRRTYEVLNNSSVTWDQAYSAWTDEHQSAECLYLIFANNTLNGQPLLDQLRDRDIADTDGDGMPEIIDPWGSPVLWMRSPAGHFLKNRWVDDESNADLWPTVLEVRETIARLGADPIDILRSDPRQQFVDDDAPTDLINPSAINSNIEADKLTFFCRPMVVSAGADEEFDLVRQVDINPTGRETISDDAYSMLTVPSRPPPPPPLPAPTPTYGSPVFFPDPFSTLPLVDSGGSSLDTIRPLLQRLGAVTDVDGDGVDDSADNVYPVLGI